MKILTHKIDVFARARQYDPTHTLTLRKRFSADMTRRFKVIKKQITNMVVSKDVFGLTERPHTIRFNVADRAFEFKRSSDKVDLFMEWLDEQVKKEVLQIYNIPQVGQASERAWTNKYVQSAYQVGIQRARAELRQKGYDVLPMDKFGGIDAAFNTPFHVDRVGLAYTRTFNELKGVTTAMDQQISRTLAQGLSEGLGPRQIARQLNDRVDKIGITRARTIARTETIRAHHASMIQEFKNAGVVGVTVIAEWVTAQDERVCPYCYALEGTQYSLEKIEGMIPYHPNCRCVAIPIDKTKESDAVLPMKKGKGATTTTKPVQDVLEFTTKEEAREFAQRELVDDVVDYGIADLDAINQINTALNQLKKRYGRKIKNLSVLEFTEDTIGTRRYRPDRIFGLTTADGSIKLNSNFVKTKGIRYTGIQEHIDRLNKKIKEYIADGIPEDSDIVQKFKRGVKAFEAEKLKTRPNEIFSADPNFHSLEDLVTHEYGHVTKQKIYSELLSDAGMSYDDEWTTIRPLIRPLDNQFHEVFGKKEALKHAGEHLSYYAQDGGVDEHFAEAFNAYTHNRLDLLTDDVVSFFKRWAEKDG